jgi:hypothetical protein
VAEIIAVIAVALGCIQLSHSLAMVHGPEPTAEAGGVAVSG